MNFRLETSRWKPNVRVSDVSGIYKEALISCSTRVDGLSSRLKTLFSRLSYPYFMWQMEVQRDEVTCLYSPGFLTGLPTSRVLTLSVGTFVWIFGFYRQPSKGTLLYHIHCIFNLTYSHYNFDGFLKFPDSWYPPQEFSVTQIRVMDQTVARHSKTFLIMFTKATKPY